MTAGVGAALEALPRGTLHVVLTKPGEAGLALSKGAEAEKEAAAAAVSGFLEAASGEVAITHPLSVSSTRSLPWLLLPGRPADSWHACRWRPWIAS